MKVTKTPPKFLFERQVITKINTQFGRKSIMYGVGNWIITIWLLGGDKMHSSLRKLMSKVRWGKLNRIFANCINYYKLDKNQICVESMSYWKNWRSRVTFNGFWVSRTHKRSSHVAFFDFLKMHHHLPMLLAIASEITTNEKSRRSRPGRTFPCQAMAPSPWNQNQE